MVSAAAIHIASIVVLLGLIAAEMLVFYGLAKLLLAVSAFFVRLGCEPHWLDPFLKRFVRWMERSR